MRHLVPALLLSMLSVSACRSARIEPFGEAKLSALCPDTKRCGTRGDTVINLLSKKGARLYLAPDKGPEQLLGKVAPKRNVASVLKTCGAEVAKNDWMVAPQVLRQFSLGDEGKRAVRERLHAYLSARVAALQIPEQAGVEKSLRSVIEAVDLDEVSWMGETYWLSDSAFERRVGQCGEEDRANIIYSLTVLSPSESFQVDLASRLSRTLNQKLADRDAGAADSADGSAQPEGPPETQTAQSADSNDAGVGGRYDTLSRDVVRALARDTRVVAALGFDNL